MIIKDNEGDWGICVATWRGMTKGKPGVPGKWAIINYNELKERMHLALEHDEDNVK
jgi:hypothetical protein